MTMSEVLPLGNTLPPLTLPRRLLDHRTVATFKLVRYRVPTDLFSPSPYMSLSDKFKKVFANVSMPGAVSPTPREIFLPRLLDHSPPGTLANDGHLLPFLLFHLESPAEVQPFSTFFLNLSLCLVPPRPRFSPAPLHIYAA